LGESVVAAIIHPAVTALEQERIGPIVEQLVDKLGRASEGGERIEAARVHANEIDVGEGAGDVATLIARLGAEQDELLVLENRHRRRRRWIVRELVRPLNLLHDTRDADGSLRR